MRSRVIILERVKTFLDSLSPEPRRALWRGVKGLASDAGDRKRLEGKLAPYWRLNVGQMRVVYLPTAVGGKRQLVCFFADYRATVYEVFEQLLASGLVDELKSPAGETPAAEPVPRRENAGRRKSP
jgi:mRNA-degrading endonuclease RelE of RelBE toxin-antitoxin system